MKNLVIALNVLFLVLISGLLWANYPWTDVGYWVIVILFLLYAYPVTNLIIYFTDNLWKQKGLSKIRITLHILALLLNTVLFLFLTTLLIIEGSDPKGNCFFFFAYAPVFANFFWAFSIYWYPKFFLRNKQM